MAYDFDSFLSSIKYLDKQDILDTAYKKHRSLDKHSSAMTTVQRMDFQRDVSDLLYLIETNQRPAHISDQNLSKLKPVCDNLVKKQQMDKSSLSIFE